MNSAPEPIAIRDAVERRLARRYRAERRFRLFGVLAIIAAVSVLAILLATLVRDGASAFTVNEIALPVQISAERADPFGDGTEESLRRGSYSRLLQEAMREQFPDVEARREVRELFGLYTPLNSARLLEDVVSDPELVGRRHVFRMPISDDADLFLKGVGVAARTLEPQSAARAVQDADRVSVLAEGEEFGELLAVIRSLLSAKAAQVEERAARELRRADAADEPDAASARRADAARFAGQAERLRAQAAPEAEEVALDASMPSVMVEIGGGVVLVERIAGDASRVSGRAVLPVDSPAPTQDWSIFVVDTPVETRRMSDLQIIWTRALVDRGLIETRFNRYLFTNSGSAEPELAGVFGAVLGTVLTMIVTMLLAVPIGVATAIYLEEFAPKNRLTDLIEVNINNLAAVPSIVFGLLGLAVFINTFGVPRSAPLVGGLVLALMTLPTVIISSRAALKAVQPSIRQAALAVGASKMQAVLHHVLPMAAPGILTGSIIGLAQAMGETAPLLMIGMVAFIADAPPLSPEGFTAPATTMPVQVYLWSNFAERAFLARAAAASLILLGMMVAFNALAIYLRQRFERRW